MKAAAAAQAMKVEMRVAAAERAAQGAAEELTVAKERAGAAKEKAATLEEEVAGATHMLWSADEMARGSDDDY